jgi:two-component system response regulator (stage 0 sporulation protein A)
VITVNDKQFAVLFEEMRLLRKQVSELINLVGSEHQEIKPMYHSSLDGQISAVLQNLMIPAHIKGYNFSREAIKMVLKDDTLLGCFSTIVYPEIAQKFNSTPSRVERAIRHAIEQSFYKNRSHPFYARFKVKNPTNCEFIALIVDKFKLEENYEEENELCQKTN